MVSSVVNLALRVTEFIFTVIIMSIVGNMIASAFGGNPSVVNYAMFVAVFAMLSLFYLIAVSVNDGFAGHAALPLALDALNILFWFCAAVAMAAELGAHSCSNSSYTQHNHITNGANDTKGRCQEAQATTAFLWFGFAAFCASLFFSALSARSSGVNMRSGGIRKGGPSMSQV